MGLSMIRGNVGFETMQVVWIMVCAGCGGNGLDICIYCKVLKRI